METIEYYLRSNPDKSLFVPTSVHSEVAFFISHFTSHDGRAQIDKHREFFSSYRHLGNAAQLYVSFRGTEHEDLAFDHFMVRMYLHHLVSMAEDKGRIVHTQNQSLTMTGVQLYRTLVEVLPALPKIE